MQRIALAALICGIMPGLMVLSNYNIPEVSAVGYDITQISTMQEMTPTICDNTEIGTEATLTDTRDDAKYTVRKLADGKCWMVENLQITKESILANGGSAKLSSDASNVTNDSTFEMPDTIQTLSTETPKDFSNEIDYNNTAQIYNPGTTITDWKEGYGAYYNWYAATAGTGNAQLISGNAPSDICPKGWRLPTGGSNGEFIKLYNFYPDTTWTTNGDTSGYWLGANNAASGGAFFSVDGGTYNGVLQDLNTHGRYWSSGASGRTAAQYLFLSENNPEPVYSSYRYGGVPIRCIASWPEKDVNVVAVRVAPVISIDAVSGMTKEVEPHKITEGEISATISANTTYNVLLSANETSLINSDNTNGMNIPTSSDVKPNNNAWGIKTNTDTYLPITTTPTTYYNTEQYDETKQSTTHTFGIGVSISPSLPSGEYSTTVTITAVNN